MKVDFSMKYLLASLALTVALLLSPPVAAGDKDDVAKVLSTFHSAAAKADWTTYFGQMSDDAIFLGTDVGERWDKPTFEGYASKRRVGFTNCAKETSLLRLTVPQRGSMKC